MIPVSSLFEQYGLTCPDWLGDEVIDDEWLDCPHSLSDDGVHQWELVDPLRHLRLCFDGELFVMRGFDDDDVQIMCYAVSSDGLRMES